MPQSRFDFVHQWSTSLADLARLMLAKLDPADREAAEHILTLLDDNNHDLESYLNGHGVDIAGFSDLNYGVAPEGNNKWQTQFGRDVVNLAVSNRIDFPYPFENGGILFPSLGDDPMNGASIAPVEASIDPTGFDINVYVGGVVQTVGLYAINWQLIGW